MYLTTDQKIEKGLWKSPPVCSLIFRVQLHGLDEYVS